MRGGESPRDRSGQLSPAPGSFRFACCLVTLDTVAVDAELLRTARVAEARLVDAERAADIARAEFRHAVRRLHLAGGSLREIAEALGLSHQRIHQIVEEAGGAANRGGWRSSTRREQVIGRDLLACSFCGKSQPGVKKLIAGPGGVYVCDQCVDRADRVIATGEAVTTPIAELTSVGVDAPAARCSFCRKPRRNVAGLAAAAGWAICTECLELCHEINAGEPSVSDSDG